jgi:arginyl-tRNA synthetase
MVGDVIDAAERSGVAYRDASGALVVDMDDKLPTFLLQRSDGGTLYHTRDVATIRFRVETFRPDQIVYVIGAPQELYLKQLFAIARALGIAGDVALVHVPFGTVFDAGGQPLSTRRGNMIYLETLLNEAHARARAIADRNRPDLPLEEREAIAEVVGIGAVIYNDLHQDPKRNITLDWDRMLALEGNSAPYIQYMYARCRSILRRAAAEHSHATASDEGLALLTHPSELDLVKQLARLPVVVRAAGQRYAAHVVADWCYETARAVAAVYRDCPVLQAEDARLRGARLRLVDAAAQGLRNGLALLGITAPEQM